MVSRRVTLLRIQIAMSVLMPVQSHLSHCSRKSLLIGSRAGSPTSLISAAKTKAVPKQAVLQAKATCLKRFRTLQKEELSIQQRALEFQTEIRKTQAEELVYVIAEADHVANPQIFSSSCQPVYILSEGSKWFLVVIPITKHRANIGEK